MNIEQCKARMEGRKSIQNRIAQATDEQLQNGGPGSGPHKVGDRVKVDTTEGHWGKYFHGQTGIVTATGESPNDNPGGGTVRVKFDKPVQLTPKVEGANVSGWTATSEAFKPHHLKPI